MYRTATSKGLRSRVHELTNLSAIKCSYSCIVNNYGKIMCNNIGLLLKGDSKKLNVQ